MKAIIIAIGDELLIGQVLDTNSNWIAQQCSLLNIEVVQKKTIRDGITPIVAAIEEAFEIADLVITTGGLGPTNDDYTAEALALYYGMNISFHQPTWDRIMSYFRNRGRTPSDTLRKQAMLPDGITLLENDLGTAPAMYFHSGGRHIISLPGVPYEMRHLFTDKFIPEIRPYLGSVSLVQRTILTVGRGETDIADAIADVESRLHPSLTLAYLPDIGKVRLRVSGKGEDADGIKALVDEVADAIRYRLGEAVYGEGAVSLPDVIRGQMEEKRLTLGLAESCTGGHISDLIVSSPGASAYYQGGIVSYSNEIKQRVLGVSMESLEKYGAVSENVVREMAEGVMRILDTDMAASVSGIAGPDGGSEEKPVGTFWVGLAVKGRPTKAFLVNFNRDRQRNIEFISVFVLNRIRLALLEMS